MAAYWGYDTFACPSEAELKFTNGVSLLVDLDSSTVKNSGS